MTYLKWRRFSPQPADGIDATRGSFYALVQPCLDVPGSRWELRIWLGKYRDLRIGGTYAQSRYAKEAAERLVASIIEGEG